jgi:predicted amidophosphoribosyltransferase
MKCPHCGETLLFVLCPECGGETPEGSLFCNQCGKPVKREKVEIDFSERIPCSDGNCIGTINEKGVCNLCGKPYNRGDR